MRRTSRIGASEAFYYPAIRRSAETQVESDKAQTGSGYLATMVRDPSRRVLPKHIYQSRLPLRISGIDFPEPLLLSQKDNSLAVFAGAGVSMPPPSNYPDFNALANQVAAGVLVLGPGEPIDGFLGRLVDRGTNVHGMVGQILTNPESKPNSLHSDLLRLFPSSDTVRLVTTNFDPHFSNAAPQVFTNGKSCEIHYAPALPLGDSFSGIVYLHGGVERPFQRLVLTDSDFGRAYLTEGWARVFLQRLFEKYTVLFVGYSHNDPVMNYLARGLPPVATARRRFALTVPGQEEHWKYRGIIPITYHADAGENPHAVLPRALANWAKQVRLGALEQEQRIKGIVDLPPPIDPEDGDYVERAFSEAATTRFFTRHATTVAWLKWVEERGHLKRLFEPGAELTEVDVELGGWFAEQFQCKHVGESLSVLRRRGGQLSSYLWNIIGHRLLRREPDDPSSEALHRWLAVLLVSRPPGTRVDFLDYLAANLVFPDDNIAALLLLEYLGRPVLHIENDFWREVQESGEDVKLELVTQGSAYWLNDFWRKFFSPNIASVDEKLAPIVTQHLQQANLLSRIDNRHNDSFDHLSFSRNMIEQSDQGAREDGIGVLVDIALGIMKSYAENRPSRSDGLIAAWFAADSFLLKRLAIFGVSFSRHWTPDRKLTWLVDNDLLYVTGLKHEVFELLKAAYPQASQVVRERVLNRARQGGFVAGRDEATAKYERYNLVYWLHTSDPLDAQAKDVFYQLQAAHPEFGKRPHPDLDVEFEQWVGQQSPKTVEEVLGKKPSDQIDYLLGFAPKTPLGPSREGLIATITEAVSRNYDWGRALAAEVQTLGAWESDLWSAIVLGWTRTELTDEQWKDVLSLLDKEGNLHRPLINELASLLDNGVKKPSRSIPDGCMGLAVHLSKKLWLVLSKDGGGPRMQMKDPDWLAMAINHPAGDITLFWLNWLVRERKHTAGEWKGLPQDIREMLDAVLREPSYGGQLGRVLLASQLNLLSSADGPWTKMHVFPLFDWAISGNGAVPAFHGFLTWGRQTENLLTDLVPLYEKLFPHLPELGRLRERFVEYLAGLSFATSINPVTHGWLTRFLVASAPKDRIHWASHVRHILRGSVDNARLLAWTSWIKPYWAQRNLGAPLPFDPLELGEMVEWAMYLGASFPEVVDAGLD